jgi:uncharacterized membrane protein
MKAAPEGVSTVEIGGRAWAGLLLGISLGAILGTLIYANRIIVAGMAPALSAGPVALAFLGAGVFGAVGWLIGAVMHLYRTPQAAPAYELRAIVPEEARADVEQRLVGEGAAEVMVLEQGDHHENEGAHSREHASQGELQPETSHLAKAHTQGVPSKAAIAGHPLHPLLVPFPVAFLVGALLTDLSYWWTADPYWARTSLWLVGAGLVGGGLAAVFGLVDFMAIGRVREHADGWIHFLGNATVLALAFGSVLLRQPDPVAAVLPWGIALSALIAGLLLVTGWYGGELAYRHMIGVTGHDGEHRTHRSAATSDHHQHVSSGH